MQVYHLWSGRQDFASSPIDQGGGSAPALVFGAIHLASIRRQVRLYTDNSNKVTDRCRPRPMASPGKRQRG